MRVVMLARVPRWYPFREDRLTKQLIANGHDIAGIVVEQTKTLDSFREWTRKLGFRVVAEKLLQKGMRAFVSRPGAPAVGEQSMEPAGVQTAPNVSVSYVASHNSIQCVEVVRRLRPEVVVLRGCGIVGTEVLRIPEFGTINPHYAALPAYRGMDVTEWSVLHGDPCAVSVHWVVEEVDAGTVIIARRVEVERGDTLGQIREKCAALAAELLAEALRKIASGAAKPTTRKVLEGRQYFTMHPRLRQLAGRRLQRL